MPKPPRALLDQGSDASAKGELTRHIEARYLSQCLITVVIGAAVGGIWALIDGDPMLLLLILVWGVGMITVAIGGSRSVLRHGLLAFAFGGVVSVGVWTLTGVDRTLTLSTLLVWGVGCYSGAIKGWLASRPPSAKAASLAAAREEALAAHEADRRRALSAHAVDRSRDSIPVDDPSLLIPIGHCIGAYHDLPTSADHFFQVRVGPDVHRLNDDQFKVWAFVHGVPDRDPDKPWGRHAVSAAARRAGIATPEQVLESLMADHLVVEVTPGTDSVVDFARRHRLIPLMLGLGNTAEEPWVYSAGMIGLPIVQMSAMAYDLYEWAQMDANLWLACEGAAATAVRVEIEDPLATDPLKMLNALVGTLHGLLGPNAVYLDASLAN